MRKIKQKNQEKYVKNQGYGKTRKKSRLRKFDIACLYINVYYTYMYTFQNIT